MQVMETDIPDVKLLTPKRFDDSRGFFSESWNARTLASAGIDARFVQDCHSHNIAAGTVRGLHFQAPPAQQAKLVRVVRGTVLDVAVDIRCGSPTFGRTVCAVLSRENWRQMWIPEGFAHGFCTLESETDVLYKVTGFYSPEHDKGITWDDPALEIDWPDIARPDLLSDKDRELPPLADLPAYFTMP